MNRSMKTAKFKRGDQVRLTAKEKRFIAREHEKLGIRKGVRWPYGRVGTVDGLGRRYVSVRFPGTNGSIKCLPGEIEKAQ